MMGSYPRPVRAALSRLRSAVGRATGLTTRRPPAEWATYQQDCYAQVGEDVVIDALLYGKWGGFYVDVGAHHPWRYSNTFRFYQRGWRGINIDPLPGSMTEFDRHRPRDINLELAVAEKADTLVYYQYDEPLVNTLAPRHVEAHAKATHYKLIAQNTVQARPLADILAEHLPAGQTIDFLTIDAEGYDAEVVRSNDWERFRPTLVLAEDTAVNFLEQAAESRLCLELSAVGFRPFSKLVHTLVFVDARRFQIDADGKQYVEGLPAKDRKSR